MILDRLPSRIVLILPCCIGDVIQATPTLKALRRAYPEAHITWAVGSWSRKAIENHDLLDALLDTGQEALPLYSPRSFLKFVQQLRTGKYDLAVSLVRSPLMSLAVMLSGIPNRAGLDSNGRGFGYNIRARIDPAQSRPEADIYLDVARALGINTAGCYTNVPVLEQDVQRVRELISAQRFIVINPAGGSNPGMVMDAKRYPPESFAFLAETLKTRFQAEIVLLAGPNDQPIVDAVMANMSQLPVTLVGKLSFGEIAALASLSRVYVGNDTGLTHLAAATGAKTVMILGPSDPIRYAPFAPNGIGLWKPATLKSGGVASGTPSDWNWSRDGIPVEDVIKQTIAFVEK